MIKFVGAFGLPLLLLCGCRHAGPRNIAIKANIAIVNVHSTLEAPKEVDVKTDAKIPVK